MGTLNLNTLFFLPFLTAHLMFTATISQPDFFHHVCSDKGNYTNDSPFKKNLDTVLAAIFSNSNADARPADYGFYHATSGGDDDPADRANAKVICRKGVLLDQCKTCVNDSVIRISQNCPNQKEATGWYPDCQILYTNNSIHSNIIMSSPYTLYNAANAPDTSDYKSEMGIFLDGLREKAASGTSIRKSGSGIKKLTSPNRFNIFGLVECFPDMSYSECDNCLHGLQANFDSCCGGSIGTRTVATSCQISYEIHPIYASLLPPPSSPPPPPSPALPPSIDKDHRDHNFISTTVIIVVVVVSILSILVLTIFIFITFKKRKPNQNIEQAEYGILSTTDGISSSEMLQFNFEAIKLGTDEFSDENKLGEGGFGVVYKCKLPNGQHVAVKRQLVKNSKEGNVEFKNEVIWVAKLQHRNLVRLLGFCLEKNEKLLVYEFVHNGNLHNFLFVDSRGQLLLNWGKRYEIISGIARGLLYLHEDSRLRIIHRDLKASNILLDESFNPKIADFGTARLFEVDETQGNTNKVVGTYGYMAPEYISHGQFSVKSDVFSFGVLLLEIVSGKKNTRFHKENSSVENLLSYTWRNWKAGTTMNVIDPTLNNGSRIEMIRCIHIGLLCVQENPGDRPTMTSVILMLSNLTFTLPMPSKPAFFMHNDIVESNAFSNSDHRLEMDHTSNLETCNEVSISELYPR